MNVLVGSKSKVKSAAVKEFFEDEFGKVSVEVYDMPSLVHEQPVGMEEIVNGAINRYEGTTKLCTEYNANGYFCVGIENGIVQKDDQWLDISFVCLGFGGIFTIIMSPTKLSIPAEFEFDNQNQTWAEQLKEKGIIENTKDPHLELTGISRKEQIKSALEIAYNQYQVKLSIVMDSMTSYRFKGIENFYDIGGLLEKPDKLCLVIEAMENMLRYVDFDAIGMIDARGFIFGSILAYKMRKESFMIRKNGKMPNSIHGSSYTKEYSKEDEIDTLSISKDLSNRNVVIVDDILATGGTFKSATKLVESRNNTVVAGLFLLVIKKFGAILDSSIPLLYLHQV